VVSGMSHECRDEVLSRQIERADLTDLTQFPRILLRMRIMPCCRLSLLAQMTRSFTFPHPTENPSLTPQFDHFLENKLANLHYMQNMGHIT